MSAGSHDQKKSEKYTMSIDLKVLDHLGINLYSNIAAVLTEAVANAWDADAQNVHINFDKTKGEIVITDDGHGMTVADMNEKYLKVGYQRRDDPLLKDKSPNGRDVMGRKGLGKLSLFSIANVVEVQSLKNGERHGLIMSVNDIKEAIKNSGDKYHPRPMNDTDITVVGGTQLILTELNSKRLGNTIGAIPQRLARRFSILASKDFKVFIDGYEITPKDRGDLKVIEFLWNIGETQKAEEGFSQIKEVGTLPDSLPAWSSDWRIKGWIGTVPTPKDLASEAGNLNSIVIMSRGRLFQENILNFINDSRHYTHYLTGYMEADFLDSGDEDLATSDRQRVIEDDEKYLALISFLKSSLSKVEKQWDEWRDKHKVDEVEKMHPAVADWFKSLPDAWRKQAIKVIAQVGKVDVEDDDQRRDLIRNAIVAFERLRLRGSTAELAQAINGSAEDVLKILSSLDDLEATLYHDIVKNRIEVIRAFLGLVDENAKETVLQKYLFEHLWLLDPAWDRATGSELIETRLKQEGIIVDDLTKKEELGRVDIKYRTSAGKHIIVELKRAGRRVTALELGEQGRLYVDKLKKILSAQNEDDPAIEVVFVIGVVLEEDNDSVTHMMNFVSPGSRVKYYDELIHGALKGYEEYLKTAEKAEKLKRLVDNI